MKKEGSLKLILSLLIIVLVVAISLGGIFVKDKNVMKNLIPDYKLGMELDTNTIIKLDVSKVVEDSSENTKEENAESETETAGTEHEHEESGNEENGQAQENTENIYTADNYKKAKKIIENRFKSFGIEQYTIRLDKNTGSIVIEVPSNSDVSYLQNAFVVGNTELKVKETNEVIGDYNSLKKINLNNDSGALRADITLSKEAQEKFKQTNNNYQVPQDENGDFKDNNISLTIDGSEVFTWKAKDFYKQAANGTLLINYFDMQYKNEIQEEIDNLNAFIEHGKLPVQYTIEYSNDIHSNISKFGVISVMAVILAVMFVFVVVKYKLIGAISFSSILGYFASLLLLIRYVKIEISVASIVAIAAITILQFIYLVKLLSNKKINSKVFNNETIEFTKMIIPIFIMSTIIAFAKITEIKGFGMIIFWGIILFEIFNNIITRNILTNVKNK